jgi:apolipoprotein N-acyltransferase
MDQASHATDERASFTHGVLSGVFVRVAGLERFRALGFAALLGALANLGFPPLHIWPFLAIALVGLIWLIDAATRTKRPARAVFWRVFAFGFAYFLVGLHWIAAAFLVDPGAHLIFIWMPLVLLPGGLAAILAFIMGFAFRFWSPGPARLILFAVAFTFAEWVRGALFGLGGLPWNLPGMVWAPGGAMSQSASIWGIYGQSLITVLALASPATLADMRVHGSAVSRAAPVMVAAVALGALWGWGQQRLALPEAPAAEGTGPLVRLVEVGTPQHQKYEPGVGVEMLRRFLELSGPDGSDAAPIVIWPEGALPQFLLEWPDALDAISNQLGDRKLIVGAARRQPDEKGNERAYNSLAVLSSQAPSRGPLSIYDKHMLVPFGEFTPLREVAASIGIPTLQALAKDGFYPGARPSSQVVVGIPPFGPLICYEAIFPGLSPTGPDRPEWLVSITNDSWFGMLSGPYQHADQARYRAIEEGLPMARVAAGGFTGMIDAYGRWTARGAPADAGAYSADPEGWRSSIVEARIPPALAPTPYSQWRDGLFWVMLIGVNLGLLVLPRR